MKANLWLKIAAVIGVSATLVAVDMKATPKLGTNAGKLFPCPSSPNCVCSQDPQSDHQIPPLSYNGSKSEVLPKLKKLILGLRRTRLLEERENYLRFEFRSAVFRFVDDVEFLLDDSTGVIHVRSASRTGYSDLGANRKRVERIRRLWTELEKPTPR
jgi:uncharacterized protein (DUF1499 family)